MSNPPAMMSDEEYEKFVADVYGRGAATGEALSTLDQARVQTARGRAAVSAENILANIEKLEALRDRVGGPQARRIDGIIANLRKQLGGEPDREGIVGTASDLARGAATGVANAAPMLADLALVLPDLAGSRMAGEGRNLLREVMERNREGLDPRGAAGITGEIAGGMVAGIPGYGGVARGAGNLLAKASPAMRRLLTAQSRAGSAAANVVTGLPISLLQAAGTDEGIMSERGAIDTAIGVGADALFGAIFPGAQIKLPETPKIAQTAKQQIVDREAAIAAINAEAAAKSAAQKAEKEMRRAVRAEWEQNNPGKSWKDDVPNKIKIEMYAARRAELEAAKPKEEPKPAQTSPVEGAAATPAAATPTPAVVEPSTPVATPEQLSTLRKNIAIERAKEAAATTPEAKQDAAEAASMFESMLARLEGSAQVEPKAPPAGTIHPVTQQMIAKRELKAKYAAVGLEFDPNKSVDQLWEELLVHQKANQPTETLEDLLAQRPAFAERAPESPAHAQALADIDAKITALGGTISTEPVVSTQAPVPKNPEAAARARPLTSAEKTDIANIIAQLTQEPVALANLKARAESQLGTANNPWAEFVLDEIKKIEGTTPSTTAPSPTPSPAGTAPEPVKTPPATPAVSNLRTEIENTRGGFEVFLYDGDNAVGRLTVNEFSPGFGSAHDIVIDDAYRGKGLSKALYQAASQRVKLFSGLTSLTESGARASKSAERLGYTTTVREDVSKSLDQLDDTTILAIVDTAVKKGLPLKAAKDFLQSIGFEIDSFISPSTQAFNFKKVSTKQLNKRDDEIIKRLDELVKAGDLGDEYKALQNEMEAIVRELDAREAAKAAKKGAKTPKTTQEVPVARTQNTTAATGPKPEMPAELLPPEVRPKAAVDEAQMKVLVGKPPSELSIEQLQQVNDYLKARLDAETDPELRVPLPERAANVATLQARQARIMKEIAKREAAPPTGPDGQGPIGGMRARPGFASPQLLFNREVGAFTGGFISSYVYNDDLEESERLSRSFAWGLMSSGAAWGTRYLRARSQTMKKPVESDLLPAAARNAGVKLQEDINPSKTPLTTYLRKMYADSVRGTFGLRRFVQATGKQSYPAEMNPAKLADMMGRYIPRTEQFISSGGRLTYELDGEPIEITNQTFSDLGLRVDPLTGDAPFTLARILREFADDDTDALGQVAVAFASLEGAGRGKMPMTQQQAEAIIRAADERLIRGAKELRKYNMALMITAHKSGGVNGARLSLEGLRSMDAEEWYTPFQYLLRESTNLDANARATVAQPDPIKGRSRPAGKPVRNPYEVTLEMTWRVLRANEVGMILNSLVDHVEAMPVSMRNQILEPISSVTMTRTQKLAQAVSGLRQVSNMSERDAKGLLSYLEGEDVIRDFGRPGANHAIMRVFRNGELQTYRLKQPEIYQALKSLTPTEIDWYWRFLGLPARTASKGVVYSPIFITRMAFIDTFQAFLGSKYGFRPGIDNIRGLYHALKRTPEYKRMLDMGGPGTIQSLSYVDPGTAASASRTSGEKTLDRIVRNLKEFKLVEVYKAIALPFAEAARVGEYLRALDHGAATLEGVYAAWDVVGNPRMQGAAAFMRGFNMATMFSRPAISAIDKLVTETGLGPVTPEFAKTPAGQAMQRAGLSARQAAGLSLMTKGFVGITLPSMMIWYLNKDDEEIKQLRQTETGQLFWFMRQRDGSIAKIRKPHVIGQLFGSSAEAFLDQQMDGPDAQRYLDLLDGIVNDASLNTLPQLGVITLGLWANKAPGIDAPIEARRDEQLSPALRGYDKASLPARIVADELKPVSNAIPFATLRRAMSPAGLDYVVRNVFGMLGEDAIQAFGAAVEYSRDGFVPPKEELPMVGRLFAKYPSMNVRAVQDFYARDKRVWETARDLDFWMQRDPTQLMDYFNQNADLIVLVDLHKKARQRVADLRRAIEDVRSMPREYGDAGTRRRLEQQFVRLIQDELEMVNQVASAQRAAMQAWQKQNRP